MFDDLAFVWPGNSWQDIRTTPHERPVCTVAAWASVLGCGLLGWDSSKPETVPTAAIRRYRYFMVNLFHDSLHVTQIRDAHPGAVIIAMPDPSLHLVLYENDTRIWRQMLAADVIGGRTQQAANVYGAYTGKPAVWLPSPIGPVELFRRAWEREKGDHIIATDHHGDPRTAVPTLAALRLVQQESGRDIHFYAAGDHIKAMADLIGLRVTWFDTLDYPRFVHRVAEARLSIDLYMAISHGRYQLTCAMAGTPVVGSTWNNPAGTIQIDPLDPKEAWAWVRPLLANPERYERRRRQAFERVQGTYGFEASRRRVVGILEGLRG